LGFSLGGYHQSKPEFQAWVQGDVRIVVEDDGPTGGSTAVTGLGVIVDDATAAAERAMLLKATPVPRVTAEDEEDLHPVYTPSGSELYFCGPGSDGRGRTWVPESGFDPEETHGGTSDGARINAVHH